MPTEAVDLVATFAVAGLFVLAALVFAIMALRRPPSKPIAEGLAVVGLLIGIVSPVRVVLEVRDLLDRAGADPAQMGGVVAQSIQRTMTGASVSFSGLTLLVLGASAALTLALIGRRLGPPPLSAVPAVLGLGLTAQLAAMSSSVLGLLEAFKALGFAAPDQKHGLLAKALEEGRAEQATGATAFAVSVLVAVGLAFVAVRRSKQDATSPPAEPRSETSLVAGSVGACLAVALAIVLIS